MKNAIHATLVALVIAGFCGTPVAGADLTLSTGGRVSIELVFSEASFSNTLALASPNAAVAISGCKLEPANGLGGLAILSEKKSQRGCRVDLDSDPITPGIQAFNAGATLRFNFCAQTDADPECEFVWSSNPGSNPDAMDHLMTTPLRAVEFPGLIFQLAWEDQNNLGDPLQRPDRCASDQQ